MEMNTKLRMDISKLIVKIESEGCHCDSLYGWLCGVHEPIRKLSKLISDTLRANGQ